jgi:rfaE bifunctional protein kinase chain/domain
MVKKIAVENIKSQILKKMTLLEGKKVLIVGDIGVDEYVLGQVRRISPEAPVPVLEVDEEDSRLGLSANVAQNIIGLGGIPYLVSVMGKDMGANTLKTLLKKNQINFDYLIEDEQRPTTRKTRIMAKHHHLVRVDYELRQFISNSIRDQILFQIEKLMPQMDIVVLQDYAKGIVEEKLVEKLIEVAHRHQKLVLLDPHRDQPLKSYRGVDLCKPNFDEALALAGVSFEDFKINKKNLIEIGDQLRGALNSQWLILTQGKEGMTIFDGENIRQVPTFARQVFDVTGAGDTVVAALALSLAAGLSIDEACVLSNFAAGVVVGKVGCVPCPKEELIDYINSHDTYSPSR